MKKIGLFIGLFLYSLTTVATDCMIAGKDYLMLNWTGQCVNGLVNGQGGGVSSMNSNTPNEYEAGMFEAQKNVSRKTGLYYSASKGNASFKLIEVWKIDKSTQEMFKVNPRLYQYRCVEGCMPYINKNSTWIVNRFDAPDIRIPLDTLVDDLYKEIQKQGIASMDPVTFKSYLFAEESNVKAAELKKLEMIEDPPVAGIRLSLGGDAKPKKKSKK